MIVESLPTRAPESVLFDEYFLTPNIAHRICRGTSSRRFQSTGFSLEVTSIDSNCCLVTRILNGYKQTTTINVFPNNRGDFLQIETLLESPAFNKPVRTIRTARPTHNRQGQSLIVVADEEGIPLPENQAASVRDELHELRMKANEVFQAEY